MSATDELRRLLDERGVARSSTADQVVYFHDMRGYKACAYDAPRCYGNGVLCLHHTATPEQAVEATLGRGTCHDSNNRFNAWQCSECGATMLLMFDDCGEPTFSVNGIADVPRFCPSCGKRVRGADERDEWKRKVAEQ